MANYNKNEDCIYPQKPLDLDGIAYWVLSEQSFEEPVSLDEFKEYAFIDYATDDTAITSILKSTRIQAETYLSKSLGVKTIEFTALSCPENYRLLFGPIDEILTEGFTHFGGMLIEGGEKITVQFTTTCAAVNEDVKEAIKAQSYYRYQNRDRFMDQSFVNMHDTFKEKLNPYRNISWP